MANIFDMIDVWNDGGVTYNAIKMNVTNTASANNSKLLLLQVDNSTKLSVSPTGDLLVAGNITIQDQSGTLTINSSYNTFNQQFLLMGA